MYRHFADTTTDKNLKTIAEALAHSVEQTSHALRKAWEANRRITMLMIPKTEELVQKHSKEAKCFLKSDYEHISFFVAHRTEQEAVEEIHKIDERNSYRTLESCLNDE